jgi:hypothetical protein
MFCLASEEREAGKESAIPIASSVIIITVNSPNGCDMKVDVVSIELIRSESNS